MKNLTNQEAVKTIQANWPGGNGYTSLKEALTLAIGLLRTGAKNV